MNTGENCDFLHSENGEAPFSIPITFAQSLKILCMSLWCSSVRMSFKCELVCVHSGSMAYRGLFHSKNEVRRQPTVATFLEFTGVWTMSESRSRLNTRRADSARPCLIRRACCSPGRPRAAPLTPAAALTLGECQMPYIDIIWSTFPAINADMDPRELYLRLIYSPSMWL